MPLADRWSRSLYALECLFALPTVGIYLYCALLVIREMLRWHFRLGDTVAIIFAVLSLIFSGFFALWKFSRLSGTFLRHGREALQSRLPLFRSLQVWCILPLCAVVFSAFVLGSWTRYERDVTVGQLAFVFWLSGLPLLMPLGHLKWEMAT